MFPYAPKLYREYLQSHPALAPGETFGYDRSLVISDDIRFVSNVPAKMPSQLVSVNTAPAGATRKPRIFGWRRMVFQTYAADEFAAGSLCEVVRDAAVRSVYARIGVHKVNVIGEPARLDDPNIIDFMRFQTTIDALFRANL